MTLVPKRLTNTEFVRCCAVCKGPVRSHHEAFQVTVPARDERGQFSYEYVFDKQTGTHVFRQCMVKLDARGLGHWECERGCRKRHATVERVINAKGATLPFHVMRDIVVATTRKATKRPQGEESNE